MKYLLLSLVSIVCFTATFAQKNVSLHLSHRLGNDQLELKKGVSTGHDYQVSIERLSYYISKISIYHDGGQEATVDDTWLLIHAPEDTDFDLGSFDLQSIDSIRFAIGVEEEMNHLDPSTYPAGHPLAPQDPSMHWGWAAGYRFVALEGKTGSELSILYEIHALGDANFFYQTIATTDVSSDNGILTINLIADYMGFFDDNNVSSGIMEHSETGHAAKLLKNAQSKVFRAGYIAVGLADQEQRFSSLQIFPNPATAGDRVQFVNFNAPKNCLITISDLSGKEISRHAAGDDFRILQLPQLHSGMYLVRMLDAGNTVSTSKLIIR